MTAHDTLILALFSRARALARGFDTVKLAVPLIAGETGLCPRKVRAALSRGFSSQDTRARLAAWNGLTYARVHGAPVLMDAPGSAPPVPSLFPDGGPVPQAPAALMARLDKRLGGA
ncbi:MAG: hypothetical protein JJ902_18315 [Roseibium sp.]|nr:hypothetical protein [Roseibium sp.]